MLILSAFVFLVSTFLMLGLIIIPLWMIFKKAGQAGWKSIIPFYNYYILTQIGGVSWWVFLGIFIPFLNIITVIFIYYHVSQKFGHSMGYALGIVFLPFIFLPILGYGSSVYSNVLSNEELKKEDNVNSNSVTDSIVKTEDAAI